MDKRVKGRLLLGCGPHKHRPKHVGHIRAAAPPCIVSLTNQQS